MLISELIADLKSARNIYGDLDVLAASGIAIIGIKRVGTAVEMEVDFVKEEKNGDGSGDGDAD